MKPPDEKMPEELRNRILEQMPWLNNPNNPIPIVDPADIKALWQQSNDPEAQPREPGAVLMINRKAVACRPGADIASVVHRLGMLELANKAMGLMAGWEARSRPLAGPLSPRAPNPPYPS